jgi:hypothetical protein
MSKQTLSRPTSGTRRPSMRDLATRLPRTPLPSTSVNRLQLRTVSRSLTRPLLTPYSSRAAGCYVRTQKVEEILGESGRASDSHSPPGHVGARDGGYGSRLKSPRQTRAAMAYWPHPEGLWWWCCWTHLRPTEQPQDQGLHVTLLVTLTLRRHGSVRRASTSSTEEARR